jgi:quinol monooxygenase YgiN
MADYTVLLTLKIMPARLAEFEAMMEVEAPLTRAFAGCELFEVYVLDAASGDVLFLEHWRTEDDSQAYGRWRTERGDMERLGAFFSAPPARAVLRRISTPA